MLPKGAHVWYRGDNGLWWLEKNQCEYDGGWGIPRPNFGRSGAVQAPSFPGALHDLRGGRTRFLVCLLYTSDAADDTPCVDLGGRRIIKKKQISASTTEDGVSLAQILDDPGPFKLPLFPARYTTSAGAVRGSWCLQVHVASAFSRGVQRKVDDSRGAAVISLLSRRRRARLFSGFLGSPPWITSGTFCVLRSSSFSLGSFRCFGILPSGFGASFA